MVDSDLSYAIRVSEKVDKDTGVTVMSNTQSEPDWVVDPSQAHAVDAGSSVPSEKPADGQEAESDACPVLSDEWFAVHIEAISKEIVDMAAAFASDLKELDGKLSRLRTDMREARAGREKTNGNPMV